MFLTAAKACLDALKSSGRLNDITAWYMDVPDSRAAFPYGVYMDNSSGRANVSGVKQADVRLFFKAVGRGYGQQTATKQRGQAIREVLDEADLTGDLVWHIWRCQVLSAIEFPELVGEELYTHSGGLIRVRMSK